MQSKLTSLMTMSSLYGDSEELLGKWFKKTGLRNKIFLSTKFGFVKGEGQFEFGADSSPEYCKKACEKSLKALGTDYIDLCKIADTGTGLARQLTER